MGRPRKNQPGSFTTIQIQKETKLFLDKMKIAGRPYADIINTILQEREQFKEKMHILEQIIESKEAQINSLHHIMQKNYKEPYFAALKEIEALKLRKP